MSEACSGYTPGTGLAAVGDGTWALLAIDRDDDRGEFLWAALDDPEELLARLIRGGLRNLPGFAVAWRDAEVMHCAFRAPITVRVGAPGAERTLEGAAHGPWTQVELSVDEPMTLTLTPSTVTGDSALPIGAGVALADALQVDYWSPTMAAARGETSMVAGAPAPVHLTEPVQQVLPTNTTNRNVLRKQVAEAIAGEPAPPTPPTPEMPAAPLDASVVESVDVTATWFEPPSSLVGGEAPPPHATPDPEPPGPESGIVSRGPLIDGIPGFSSVPSVASPAPAPAPPTQAPSRYQAISASLSPTPPGVTPNDDDSYADAATTGRDALLQALPSDVVVGPSVYAFLCASGHPSPPSSVSCRLCGLALPEQAPREIARPSLGRLELSNGVVVALERDVIFGRRPVTDVDDPLHRPNLIRLTESGELSRMHTMVRLDGWNVLVRDLGSSHGTEVALPGESPFKLRAEEDYILEPESVVSLADIVTFRFVVAP